MDKIQIDWNVCDCLRNTGLTAESEYVRSLHEELHRTRKINTALSDALQSLECEMVRHKNFVSAVVDDLVRVK